MESHVTHLSPNQRVWVIGDVHGDHEATNRALMAAGVAVDDGGGNLRWSGGDSIVVMCGDILDGRPRDDDSKDAFAPGDEVKILRSLDTLKKGARKEGGRLITLVGNHELMNAQGNFSYVHPIEKRDEAELPSARRALVRQFLDQGDVFAVFKICNVMFVHGGLTKEIVAGLRTINIDNHNVADNPLDRINAVTLGALRRRNEEGEECGTALPDAVFGPDGLMWTRGQMYGDTAEKRATDLDQIFQEINTMLFSNANTNANANVDTLVVGHTVQGYDDDDGDGEFDVFASSTPPHNGKVATLHECLESNQNWATLREYIRNRGGVGSAVALRMRRGPQDGHRLICVDVGMSAAFRRENEPSQTLNWPCALLLEQLPRSGQEPPLLAPKCVCAWVDPAPDVWAVAASARWALRTIEPREPPPQEPPPREPPPQETPMKSLYRHCVKWSCMGWTTQTSEPEPREQIIMAITALKELRHSRRYIHQPKFVEWFKQLWANARAEANSDANSNAFAELLTFMRVMCAGRLSSHGSPPWHDAMFICAEPGMGRGVMAFRDIPKGHTIKINSNAFVIKAECDMDENERKYAWGDRVFEDHNHPAIMMNEAPVGELADAYVVHDDLGNISIEFVHNVSALSYVHTYYNSDGYTRNYIIDNDALRSQLFNEHDNGNGGVGDSATRRKKPQPQHREWEEVPNVRFDMYNTAYKSGLGQGKLEIFDTDTNGKGVRALVSLPSDAILTKYEGRLLDAEQFENMDKSKCAYVAALPGGYVVDGMTFGQIQEEQRMQVRRLGLGSLINDPRGSPHTANCVTYSPPETKPPSLYIVSKRVIEAGEELLMNYGGGGGL